MPVKPAFHAPVKLCVLASSTFMLFTWSKLEVLSGGALSNGTDCFWNAASAAFRVFCVRLVADLRVVARRACRTA